MPMVQAVQSLFRSDQHGQSPKTQPDPLEWPPRWMKINRSRPHLQLQSQAMLAARLFALNTASATLAGAVERANTTKTATIKG